LTHGNSSQAIDDVKKSYDNMLNKFEYYLYREKYLKYIIENLEKTIFDLK
jgi:hypothetical protein